MATAVGCGANPAPSAPPGAPTPTPRRVLGILPVPPPPAPTPTPVPTPIRFAHWLDGDARRTLDGLIADHNRANPHVAIQGIARPFGEQITNLSASFAAGDPPDAFLDSGPLISVHQKGNALLDLTSRIADDRLHLELYWADPPCRPFNGGQYAVPLWCAVDLLYYSRDAFASAGLPEPAADWTWEDLLATAVKLTEGKPGEVTRWGLLVINDLTGGWGGLATSNGGRWLDPATGQTDLDPPSVEALQWVSDAINLHHVAPSPFVQQQLTRGGELDPFLTGSAAMLVNGTWEMPPALAQSRVSWDAVRLPRAPRTGESASVASAQPGAIARASRHPDEAWQWLRRLLDDPAQMAWARGKLRLPSSKAIAADPVRGYAAAPPVHAALASAALANARDLQFRAGWQGFRAALLTALDPVFNGQIPLREALPKAIQAADRALAGAL